MAMLGVFHMAFHTDTVFRFSATVWEYDVYNVYSEEKNLCGSATKAMHVSQLYPQSYL